MEFQLPGFIPEQVVKAICSTLIHSLWEGLILAIVAAVTIVLTRKASSDLRYKLLTAYLLLFTAGILFTFFTELAKSPQSQGQVLSGLTAVIKQNGFADHVPIGQNQSNIFSVFYDYLNGRSSTVVLIWFLVMWLKYLRFAAGLYHVYCLKRMKILPAGRHWERKLDELSAALGIKDKVAILQSGLTKIPITLGHFKPLVLIPIGLLNNLSAAEVEAILLHELSHIKRKDYLVNLLQSILEIILFFNPALLWVSALIKAERENCCDDMVISRTSDKVTYIQALLSCQEYNATNHALAMGLSGKKSSLIGRVRRIVSNNNQTLNVMEKGFLTFSMVTAVLVTLTVSSTDASAVKNAVTVTRKVLIRPIEENVLKPVQESFVRSRQETADTSKRKKLVYPKATRVAEAGVRLEEARLSAALDTGRIKQAEERLRQGQERTRQGEERAKQGALRAAEGNARAAEGAERLKQGSERAAQGKVRAEASAIMTKESEERAAQSEIRAKASAERAKQSEIRARKVETEAANLRDGISEELIDAGVIKDKSELNFRLSADELIVNGKKQPEELQKKLSEKYIIRKGMVINVGNSATLK